MSRTDPQMGGQLQALFVDSAAGFRLFFQKSKEFESKQSEDDSPSVETGNFPTLPGLTGAPLILLVVVAVPQYTARL